MKILLVHNHYLNPGGEDQVFATETQVLRSHGDEVQLYTLHNNAIASMNRFRLASSTVWNREVFQDLTRLLQNDPPDIVHFHNTFPLVSPAAYSAVRQLGIPVVQTLHNFRLFCVNGLFLREGRICEDCLGKSIPWPGVVHACYRGSRLSSAVTAAMVGFHRWRGTWETEVDTYIAVSEFARAKFIAGGLPPERIIVKPNFLSEDPGIGTHSGGYALYVGRLSQEKGIESLVRVWNQLAPGMPLHIIGSGPLEHLRTKISPRIEWLGWQSHERVLEAMKGASFLVFPSECYESFGMVLVEAMATGLPIVAANIGAVPEIVRDGSTGVLVQAGDNGHWSVALRWALSNSAKLAEMGRRARLEFESKYTPQIGYRLLSEAYQHTLDRARGMVPPASL